MPSRRQGQKATAECIKKPSRVRKDDKDAGFSTEDLNANALEKPAGEPGFSRKPRLPTILANRFAFEQKKLGEGSFGCVYKATDNETGESVAVKLENKRSFDAGMLKNEADILLGLAGEDRPQGFLDCILYTTQDAWNCLVISLGGINIEDTVEMYGTLDVGSAALIADRAIICLAYLHSKYIVHRDIKCENFLFGRGPKAHHLHLIDFGMSTLYWQRSKHVPLTKGQDLTGTARYASINAMKGLTQSRRDDLEALAHILIYILKGNLPWSGLKAADHREKLQRILYNKRTLPIEDICKDLPGEFAVFLAKTRSIRFEQQPNYDSMRGLFKTLRDRMFDDSKDWQLKWLVDPKNEHYVEDPSTLQELLPVPKCALQPEDLLPPSEEPDPDVASRSRHQGGECINKRSPQGGELTYSSSGAKRSQENKRHSRYSSFQRELSSNSKSRFVSKAAKETE